LILLIFKKIKIQIFYQAFKKKTILSREENFEARGRRKIWGRQRCKNKRG
jgi:hypothetical protein